MQIGEKWRDDPGIRYICYYGAMGPGVDGYSHHFLVEVDDVSKIEEMNNDLWTNKDLLLEKASVDVVFGETNMDDFYGDKA